MYLNIEKRDRLEPAPLRLPTSIRRAAQELARAQSTATARVTETDVYRTIIENFFGEVSTETSQERQV